METRYDELLKLRQGRGIGRDDYDLLEPRTSNCRGCSHFGSEHYGKKFTRVELKIYRVRPALLDLLPDNVLVIAPINEGRNRSILGVPEQATSLDPLPEEHAWCLSKKKFLGPCFTL